MKITKVCERGEVRSFQKTGFRCLCCNHPFTAELEVDIDIRLYVKNMSAIRCPECNCKKIGMGLGLSISEDRSMRLQGGTLVERIEDWITNGETGASSLYVAKRLSDPYRKDLKSSYPHDYDDLRRVILLIDRIPEWSSKMDGLKNEEGWEKIATQWNEIVAAVLEADPEAISPKTAAPLLETVFKGR